VSEKTMEIRGIKYREAKVRQPIAPVEMGAVCAQCEFVCDRYGCGQAIEQSAKVFGGDCMERDVVYDKAEVAP
jgi:hypothetical protein